MFRAGTLACSKADNDSVAHLHSVMDLLVPLIEAEMERRGHSTVSGPEDLPEFARQLGLKGASLQYDTLTGKSSFALVNPNNLNKLAGWTGAIADAVYRLFEHRSEVCLAELVETVLCLAWSCSNCGIRDFCRDQLDDCVKEHVSFEAQQVTGCRTLAYFEHMNRKFGAISAGPFPRNTVSLGKSFLFDKLFWALHAALFTLENNLNGESLRRTRMKVGGSGLNAEFEDLVKALADCCPNLGTLLAQPMVHVWSMMGATKTKNYCGCAVPNKNTSNFERKGGKVCLKRLPGGVEIWLTEAELQRIIKAISNKFKIPLEMAENALCEGIRLSEPLDHLLLDQRVWLPVNTQNNGLEIRRYKPDGSSYELVAMRITAELPKDAMWEVHPEMKELFRQFGTKLSVLNGPSAPTLPVSEGLKPFLGRMILISPRKTHAFVGHVKHLRLTPKELGMELEVLRWEFVRGKWGELDFLKHLCRKFDKVQRLVQSKRPPTTTHSLLWGPTDEAAPGTAATPRPVRPGPKRTVRKAKTGVASKKAKVGVVSRNHLLGVKRPTKVLTKSRGGLLRRSRRKFLMVRLLCKLGLAFACLPIPGADTSCLFCLCVAGTHGFPITPGQDPTPGGNH